MVAGWGAILILGVTDPLGGINTFFPLFGIANQLLAAIALAVCMALAARGGVRAWLWIPVLPLTFAAVVTITASLYKIFSPVPAVGYWAQNKLYRDALAAGKTSQGTAKTPEAMEAVVRNTTVQGTLSIVFVTLAIIVITAAIIATVRILTGADTPDDRGRPPRVDDVRAGRIRPPTPRRSSSSSGRSCRTSDPSDGRTTERPGHLTSPRPTDPGRRLDDRASVLGRTALVRPRRARRHEVRRLPGLARPSRRR